jgi:hypothetical protein
LYDHHALGHLQLNDELIHLILQSLRQAILYEMRSAAYYFQSLPPPCLVIAF